MGSVISRVLGGPALDDSSPSSSEPSKVLAFHSSQRWQLYFNAAKESSQLMVIDFSAAWCGPCKLMEPIVNSLSSKFTDVDFVKIDVDELSDVGQKFKVEAMPTFVFLKDGKEVDRVVGAKPDDLAKKVEKHRV